MRRGFGLLDLHAPAWREEVTPGRITSPDDPLELAARSLGVRRVELFLKIFGKLEPGITDLLGHGFYWERSSLGSNPVPIWRRLIRETPSWSRLIPVDDDLVECGSCGAPRHDDVSVQWRAGTPYCDPACP